MKLHYYQNMRLDFLLFLFVIRLARSDYSGLFKFMIELPLVGVSIAFKPVLVLSLYDSVQKDIEDASYSISLQSPQNGLKEMTCLPTVSIGLGNYLTYSFDRIPATSLVTMALVSSFVDVSVLSLVVIWVRVLMTALSLTYFLLFDLLHVLFEFVKSSRGKIVKIVLLLQRFSS